MREVYILKRKLEELATKNQCYEQDEEESIKNKQSLAKLYNFGVFNSDGEYNE